MYKVVGGDGKHYGPVSADEVRAWIKAGRLNGKSLAWLEGTTEWKPLESFPDFVETLRAVAGPAIPPLPGQPILPADRVAWQNEVLARHAEVGVGGCFGRSWRLFTQNFGVLVAGVSIVWALQTICERVPLIGPLALFVFNGVLYGGLYMLFLKKIRGQSASVGDVFCGFQIAFVQLLLAGLVSKVLYLIGIVCCLILPGIYLGVAWIFAIPLVADKGMEFWSAMELSRKIVTRVWFEIFIIIVAFFIPILLVNAYMGVRVFSELLPMIQNMTQSNNPPDPMQMADMIKNVAVVSIPLWLLSKFVALLMLPLAMGARMYAYEDLFGPRSTPAA